MAAGRERRAHGGAVKKIITIVVILSLLSGGGYALWNHKSKSAVSQSAEAAGTDPVMRGDVSLTITGSAAVEPYERYEIIPKVSGDIISCPYEVGDIIQKGAVLYKFDTTTTDISMERQRISLEQSETNYQNALKDKEKLSITADAEGVISNLTFKTGDEIKSGTKLADISNTELLEVSLPFNEAQASRISIGDTAYVSSSVHMSNVTGTVSHKDASSHAGADGSRLYNVTITFNNPGAFYEGMEVGGAVGNIISSGSGKIAASDSGSATAEAEGTITNVYYANGDYVKKGAVIATIRSDTITNSIKNSQSSYETAKLSMQDAQESLADYSLTSPITGTVITKNSKAGDTIDRTNSTQTLMVIADISCLKFELEIDELDVSKVSAGQKVEITCDALPGETYIGEITNLSVEGTSANGVTTYTADVVINEPGNLRPSMNIDASVVVESSENTLYVPSEDVKSIGNMYYVFKKSDKTTQDAHNPEGGNSQGKPEGNSPAGSMPEHVPDGTEPKGDSAPNDAEQKGDSAPDGNGGDNQRPGGRGSKTPNAPDGFEFVQVEVGVIGDEYTEILSGLSEGDEVYTQTSSSSSRSNNMMGGMPMGGAMGGSPGGSGMGGVPGGGMGGGPR